MNSDNGRISLPEIHEIPHRLTQVELSHGMRLRDHGERLQRIESTASRIGWGILGALVALILTVISASVYVGRQFESVSNLGRSIDSLTLRLDRLEDRAMRGDR